MAQNMQKIGDYSIIKTLGSGNFGKAYVCKGRDCDSGTYVLKQIDLNGLDEHDTKAAIMEAELLRDLSSPCIVKYIDSFVSDDKKLSIVMEYCDGGDLATLIKTRRKSHHLFHENEIKNVLCQIAIALSHCHERNIFHRDIKTDNVFLCKNGRVKLGDFGVSKQMQDSDSLAQTAIGTPYYLSPEICKGEPYDSKSDIWALGCIMYEMMNFQRPFQAENIVKLALNITSAKFPPLSPKYSDGLRKLISELLNKDPSMRPPIDEILSKDVLTQTVALLSPLQSKPSPKKSNFDDITAWAETEMDKLEQSHLAEIDKIFENIN